MLDTFEKAGFDFARYSEVTCKDVPQDIMDDILNILLEEKQIVKINDEMYTLTSYMETAKEKIREHLKEDPLITIAQVRDMFATSRKSAKPILEYMDAFPVNNKIIFINFYLFIQTSMNRIIFQKISSCFRAAWIVDGDNIQIRSVKKPPKNKTSNSSKTVNCYFCHSCTLL